MDNSINLKALEELSKEEKKVALEILEQMSKEGNSDILNELKYADFDEIPVDIHTFMHDKKYLGCALYDQEGRFTIFPYWEKVLKDIFPDNLTTHYNTVIFTGAIGLGKSTIAVICLLYMLYRLLCLKDPYLYYGMQPVDKISISFMNITLENAKGVALDKMNQMILSSNWFLTHGEMTGDVNLTYRPEKHIEVIAASSNNQVIGRALFANFSDEVNFGLTNNIEKQKKKLKTLISQIDARMKSRFLRGTYLPTLNIIASSKNSEQSFLEDYIDNKKKIESKTTLIIDEPQWVVDSRKDSPEKFYVAIGNKYLSNELLPLNPSKELLADFRSKGYSLLQVPIGYLENFQTNIDGALTDIAGIATAASLKYISGQRWKDILTARYENPFIQEIIEVGTAKDDLAQYADYFELTKVDPEIKAKPLYIHLDMSKGSGGKGDKTGIAGIFAMGKRPTAVGEPDNRSMYFRLAFGVSIKAPKGHEISFDKHRIFIRWLKEQGFNIKGISCDTFQSSQIQQQLIADGFDVRIISVDRIDSISKTCLPYAYFKSSITERRLEVYKDCEFLTEEVLGLERESDGHINHPENGKYGCFTGDTKVSLVDGRELTFLELVNEFNSGKNNYVYSFNSETKCIEPKQITKAWCTQRNAALIEVELDNGEVLQCTPNHKFMLRDGSFKEAKDLTENESLMPLYRKYPTEVVSMKNYRMYYEPIEDKWHYEHRRFATEILDKKYLVHHKNCNREDNTPTNLLWCSKEAHLDIHKKLQTGAHSQKAKIKKSKSLVAWYNDPENSSILEQKCQKLHKARLRQIGWTEAQFLERQAEKEARKLHGIELKNKAIQSKQAKELYIKNIENTFNINWSALTNKEKNSYSVKYQRLTNPETQLKINAAISENHKHGKYSNAYRALSLKNAESQELKKLIPSVDRAKFIEIFGFDYDSIPAKSRGPWCVKYRRIVGKTILNHKVRSVRAIEKTADVYDITVQDNHNFALSAGIFVHNSKDLVDACCLHGSTEIFLLSGKHKSIKELYNNWDNEWVLGYNTETAKLEPVKIQEVVNNGFKDNLIKLTLDTGAELVCTQDHRILCRDGQYIEAKDTLNKSLMPFTYENKIMYGIRDYTYVYNPNPDLTNTGIYLHKVVAESLFEAEKQKKLANKVAKEWVVIHHKDCDRKNNIPDNLEYLTNTEHSKKHTDLNQSAVKRRQLQIAAKKLFDQGTHPFQLMSNEQKRLNGSNSLTKYNKSAKHRKTASEKNKMLLASGLHPFQVFKDRAHSKEANQKRLATCEELYGGAGFCSAIIQAKCRKNCFDNNGYDNPWHSAEKQLEMRHNKIKKAWVKICKYLNISLDSTISLFDFKCACYALNIQISCNTTELANLGISIDASTFNQKDFNKLRLKGNCVRLYLKTVPTTNFTYEDFSRYYDNACKTDIKFRYRFNEKPSYSDIIKLGFNLYNHRVVKIEPISGSVVYDIKLDRIHNFALTSGIFVHNCGAMWNASLHAEEYAYDYGESLEMALRINEIVSAPFEDRRRLAEDFKAELLQNHKLVGINRQEDLDAQQKEKREYLMNLNDGIFIL